jgi:hypothetical protein
MNELLLLGQAAVSTLMVLLCWRFAREQLYGVIFIFLLLIGAGGGKLIELFGHTTNTGNIYYGAIFLAAYFLIERMGRRQGIYSIWIAVVASAFFFVCIQIVVGFASLSVTEGLNAALNTAFTPYSRLTAASLIAFVLSQNLNIYLYIRLRERWNGAKLWLRANIASVAGQMLDSVVFFSIAFWGVVPPANIVDIMLTGFVIKVVYIAIVSPLLYLNRIESEDGGDYAEISMR